MMKCGFVMDPIENVRVESDTTIAILLEAQKRGCENFYIKQQDIFLEDAKVYANAASITVIPDEREILATVIPERRVASCSGSNLPNWYYLAQKKNILLSDLDIIFMRIDPPVNMSYVYTTYLLEQAEHEGVLIVNKPQSLRDINEKLITQMFPEFCPPTLVSNNFTLIQKFFNKHNSVVLKPLNNMGGTDIFHIEQDDINFQKIVETLTEKYTQPIVAQKFLPEIKYGDKRIIMINGEPVQECMLRLPKENDIRANLAAGGTAIPSKLTENDLRICKAIGPMLRDKNILLAGLDIIGNYLTEINITSPTGIRQINQFFNVKLEERLLDAAEKLLDMSY